MRLYPELQEINVKPGISVQKEKIEITACSIFRDSLERLVNEKRICCSPTYLPSMLHMHPERLETELEKLFKNHEKKTVKQILLYGDCCPKMLDLEKMPGTARTSGINCCEIILGTPLYRKMRSEGKFFIIREWAMRWKEIFEIELGLKGENAISFMKEMHTGLVYIDEGLSDPPLGMLGEISSYSGLSFEIIKISGDPLLEKIESAIAGIDQDL